MVSPRLGVSEQFFAASPLSCEGQIIEWVCGHWSPVLEWNSSFFFLQLQAHGIAPEYITYPRVTLTSASRLCVRHSDSSRPCLTILDPHRSPKEHPAPPNWTLHHVQGAVANPTCPLLAVRGMYWQSFWGLNMGGGCNRSWRWRAGLEILLDSQI